MRPTGHRPGRDSPRLSRQPSSRVSGASWTAVPRVVARCAPVGHCTHRTQATRDTLCVCRAVGGLPRRHWFCRTSRLSSPWMGWSPPSGERRRKGVLPAEEVCQSPRSSCQPMGRRAARPNIGVCPSLSGIARTTPGGTRQRTPTKSCGATTERTGHRARWRDASAQQGVPGELTPGGTTRSVTGGKCRGAVVRVMGPGPRCEEALRRGCRWGCAHRHDQPAPRPASRLHRRRQ